jgi:hypothetical protein
MLREMAHAIILESGSNANVASDIHYDPPGPISRSKRILLQCAGERAPRCGDRYELEDVYWQDRKEDERHHNFGKERRVCDAAGEGLPSLHVW